jgi:hypothetical protein
MRVGIGERDAAALCRTRDAHKRWSNRSQAEVRGDRERVERAGDRQAVGRVAHERVLREAAAGVAQARRRRRRRRQRGRDVVEQAREQGAPRLAHKRRPTARARARGRDLRERGSGADHARSEEDGEGLEGLAAREPSRLVPVLRTTSRRWRGAPEI